jgi:uncharacterized protein involved in exopolysaccharide biosynthesis
MNEGAPKLDPEELKQLQKEADKVAALLKRQDLEEQTRLQEEADLLADYLIRHPNLKPLSPEIAEQVQEEFDSLISLFESKHSLEELHSIIDLTTKEAPNHPIREPARVDLIEIEARLSKLKPTYGEGSPEYKSIKEQYKRLSRAVGIINNNKVDHTK